MNDELKKLYVGYLAEKSRIEAKKEKIEQLLEELDLDDSSRNYRRKCLFNCERRLSAVIEIISIFHKFGNQ